MENVKETLDDRPIINIRLKRVPEGKDNEIEKDRIFEGIIVRIIENYGKIK